MAKGFALVALRNGRRGNDPPFQQMRTKIKNLLQKDSRIKAVKEITRRHGSEILSPFKIRIDVEAPKASDLPAVFQFIETTLHNDGHSHVEGYDG